MAIVGEASSGEQAVSLAHELQPDLVLMDIQMVGGNGVEATRLIVADSPQIIVLILTIFEMTRQCSLRCVPAHEATY